MRRAVAAIATALGVLLVPAVAAPAASLTGFYLTL
jgi:hypothetical protein